MGGAAHPPLQQSDSCPQAPEKIATSSFSASALAWDVPGTHLFWCPFRAFLSLSGPQQGLGPPKKLKMILTGHKVPKCSKCALGCHCRLAGLKKCFFGKICQQIFSSITSKVHGSRAAPLNGQNEGRVFEKNRFFRVCFRAQTRTHTDRGQTGPGRCLPFAPN